MKDDNKRELTPKLRFPEFQDSPVWEEKQLARVCEVNPENEGLPESFIYIDLESVDCGTLTARKRIFRKNAPSRAQRLLKDGDVIFQMVRPYQRNNLFFDFSNTDDYVASTGYAQLRAHHTSTFLYQLIHTDSFVAKVIAKCTGSNYPAINSSDLAAISVIVPRSAAEQQRIADCLTSLDNLIAVHSRKLDALKAHKKGLMQQLFPREGETIPRLRFPEFRDAPGWKVKPLEQVATYENGKAHENNISEEGQYIVVNSKFISTEGEVRKYSNDAFCMADSGDILMVLSDVPNGKAIAKCFFVEADNLYAVNQRICKIRPVGIDGKLLFKILDRNPFFLAFDDGVNQTNLRKEDVLNCPVCFPQVPEEQKKISDSVSYLDELITTQSLKLDVLKTHKKGLMQQLFPSPDEVEA
jgi:type I restriction enzyme S subunit